MAKSWSKEEVEKIKNYLRNGKNLDEISNIIERSVSSIKSKFGKRRLNISIPDLKREYYYEKTKCKNCGKNFEALKSDNRKFCNKSCSVSYNNKRRIITDDHRNNTSKSLRSYINKNGKFGAQIKQKNGWYKECPICDGEFYVTESTKDKIYCCRECYRNDEDGKYCKRKGGGYRKNSTINHRSNFKGYWMDSGSEREFAELLEENNIEWIKNSKKYFEYRDKNGKLRKYYPDFYLPEYDYWVEIKSKFYETEYLDDKLKAVGDNIEVMYHDEINIPENL